MGYVSWTDVNDALVSFGKAIKATYGMDVEYDRERNDSAIGPSKKNRSKYVVHIGRKNYRRAEQTGWVSEFDFVRTVLALYHEERHLQQDRLDFLALDNPVHTDGTLLDGPTACRMAKYHLVGKAVPEFYMATNMRNPVEHDAELYAIRETRKFFKEHFPEIDVDMRLVEIISSEAEGPAGWYADVADSCDGLVANLDRTFRDTSIGLHGNIVGFPLKNGPSRMMTKFKQHGDLVVELKTRDFQDEQMEILFEFVKGLEPERLAGYACLGGQLPKDSVRPSGQDRDLPTTERRSAVVGGTDRPWIIESLKKSSVARTAGDCEKAEAGKPSGNDTEYDD